MQPIRVIIQGNYWDSQIYRGRLYLWRLDGTIAIVNWDSLIDEVTPRDDRLLFGIALKNADYLYAYDFSLLYEIRGVKQSLLSEFARIASHAALDVDVATLSRHLIQTIESPFRALHDDCDIYNNQIYALTDSGFFRAKITPRNKSQVQRKREKLWDGLGSSLRAKSRRVAIAALGDGLFEYAEHYKEPKNIVKQHTQSLDWMVASLYCSSDRGSYVAAYHWETAKKAGSQISFDDPDVDDDEGDYYANTLGSQRRFDGIIEANELFGPSRYSWGVEDKAYSVSDGVLTVARYDSKSLRDRGTDAAFSISDRLAIAPWKGDVLSGSASFFGTLVELENAIIVLRSDGTTDTHHGPFTRWRTFPRSIRYENQLHLVGDSSVQVLAYCHDWFVPQAGKVAGITHRPEAKGYFRGSFGR